MPSHVRLELLPSVRCLFDEPIWVKVTGLRSRQEVTLRARCTDDKGVVFSSSATYRADGNGEINLSRDPSLSGSYDGVEPMGLLWSMRADALHKIFFKDKVLEPLMVNFSVHEVEGRMLAEATNERSLIGNGVRRVPVEEGNICGVLFTPPGEGPFPAVLDLNPLIYEKRASLLASKGFVVLAASVFSEMHRGGEEIHLDHFEQLVQFLQQVPEVGSKGVGIISRSKSADIALSLSAFVPGVEAVVWINGCSANTALPLYYKKQLTLPPLMYDIKNVIPTDSGAINCKYCLHDPLEGDNRATLIPIEKANSHFLFVASEDDLNWDSKAFMDQMVERLKHHGKENFENVSYPGAGHLLKPPYGPFCPSSVHGMTHSPVLWGGEPRSHAAAEVHLWKKVQEFFKTHLTCNPVQNKSKL